MGVVSGDCCGMARYQTVMSIGKRHRHLSKLCNACELEEEETLENIQCGV